MSRLRRQSERRPLPSPSPAAWMLKFVEPTGEAGRAHVLDLIGQLSPDEREDYMAEQRMWAEVWQRSNVRRRR